MKPRGLLPEALALFERGSLDEAEALCRKIIEKDRRSADAWQLLGLIQNRRGWYDRAIPCFEACLKLRPDDPLSHCRLATTLMHQGRFADARQWFESALRLDPGFALALRGRAELLEREGAVEEACALLEPLMARGRQEPETVLLAASLREKTGRREEALAAIEECLRRPAVPALTQRKLYFLRGRTLDRLERFDEAFEAWRRGNALGARPFDAMTTRAATDRILAVFSAERLPALPRAGEETELPVLIVGMPRSGSTLVEQIIDAHPRAVGAGEIAALNESIAAVQAAAGAGRAYPEAVLDLSAGALLAAGRPYLDRLRRLDPAADRVADKNLLNFKHLGLVELLYPRARVIHCRRDPVETCFSRFMNDLPPLGFPWSGDLASIGAFHREYERLMAHWRAVLAIKMLEMDYEALVEEPERHIRAIIDFCGLPWDDACLRFHETGRAVRTISYDQVRRPIYRTALSRAARYESHLGPLREALQAPGAGDTIPA